MEPRLWPRLAGFHLYCTVRYRATDLSQGHPRGPSAEAPRDAGRHARNDPFFGSLSDKIPVCSFFRLVAT
jgi:hypothetical protein